MSGSALQHVAKGNSSTDEALSKGADALEKPCLGQPFQLGMLYDCRSDSLIPGVTLWGSEALSKAVSVKPLETSDFEIIAEDSLSEKATHVGADASLKLSILGGMVKVEGAAKFLMDQKTSKQQARVSLKYKSTTRFEQLTMDQLGNFEYTDIFEKDVATHVVTGMVYGADAFFIFDREVAIDEDMKEIHGSLKVKVGGLPGLEKLAIEGQASLDLSQTDRKEEEKLHCKFYGDLILPKHPTTYRDAAKVYQDLPEFLKGKSVPKKVWLYPLGMLDSRAEKMVREISSRMIDELHILMESLHDMFMRCNDLITTEVSSNFMGLKEELEKMKGLISGYKSDLQKSLATLLPKVRGGGTSEADIAEILKTNSLSPFSPQSLLGWISGKESEVKILAKYLNRMKQEQIHLAFEPGEVDVFINDLDIDAVVCFDFGVTWGKDAQLLRMEAYLHNSEVSPGGSTGQPWYKNKAVTHEMRLQSRSFIDFANINHTRAGVKFVVTNNDSHDDTISGFVSLYDHESGCQSTFEPPGPPGKLKADGVSHTGLKLTWDKPKYGATSVKSYIVSYCSQDDAPDQWCTKKTISTKQQLVLSNLVPGKMYCFKVKAETRIGLGPDGDECEIRLPPGQPGKPHASNVTHKSLKLKWTKPKHGADIVERYTIFYRSSGDPQDKWTTHKTSDKQEFADLSGLASKTVYTFKVRAESEAGAGPDSELSDPIETILPISEPGKPTAVSVTHNYIQLKWKKPKQGAQTVTFYTVKYRPIDDPDNWISRKTPTSLESIDLLKLDSKTVYFFKVRAETPVGASPESEISDPIETKLNPPGKPFASDETYKDFQLNWPKPSYGDIQYYSVSYQATEEPPDTWHDLKTADANESYLFTGAHQEKLYVFKVAAVTSAGSSSYSEISDPIETKTMPWGAKVYKGLNPISSNPTTYLLPTHCAMKKKDVLKVHVGKSNEANTGDVVKNCSCHKRTQSGVQHKVLMVVGATGAGKTTLINGMANYIMGVQWDDDFRFKLIAEPTSKDQSKSQTMAITAYTFYKDKGSPLPYTLTVIDTPGFGDTGGLARDKYIVTQIKELFSLAGSEGIDQLHGIGFVTQAPLARLTPTQRYVFDAILSVFGKDVAGNIFLMITFADGMRPPVLDAIKAAGVPENASFKFNNSALFASKSADDEFNKMFWKMGTKSFDDFFQHFSTAQTQSLTQSRTVIQERERLETIIQGLQPQINAGLAKIDELRQLLQLLEKHEKDIITNKNFTDKVEKVRQRMIELPQGKYTTNCLTCNYTCHENCAYADDGDKYRCSAMDKGWGTTSAVCGVCPSRCSWKVHKNNPYRFELYKVYETVTLADLKKKYDSAIDSKKDLEKVIKKMKDEIDLMNKAVLRKMEQARKSIERLQEIALKPNHLTEVEYIDLLIQSEKSEAKPRFLERVQALEGVRKQAEILSELMKTDPKAQQPFFTETQQEKSMWKKILGAIGL